MAKKKIIDLNNYDWLNPAEIVIACLLKFYLDSEDDELRISLDIEKINHEKKRYGMYSMKHKQGQLLVAPPDHIIPTLVTYLKYNSVQSVHSGDALHVVYNNHEYKIPLFLSDEKGKEEIMFRKPKRLEQRI
ncbi:MAG: hypothetical protein AABX16_05455 [Nanoarchaeota archaeon]